MVQLEPEEQLINKTSNSKKIIPKYKPKLKYYSTLPTKKA
jgi:hypothetical protein